MSAYSDRLLLNSLQKMSAVWSMGDSTLKQPERQGQPPPEKLKKWIQLNTLKSHFGPQRKNCIDHIAVPTTLWARLIKAVARAVVVGLGLGLLCGPLSAT